jgi:drug/metabolite transporter (DMT)-like permease
MRTESYDPSATQVVSSPSKKGYVRLKARSIHTKAALQALFVTFLWSTSWVLIKIGLKDIPALTFAGLRYTIAFLVLLPLGIYTKQVKELKDQSGFTWLKLITLGVLFYSFTQGAQFLSLIYLPATTTSLLLSFTAVVVALLGIFFLKEIPNSVQWIGTMLYLFGVLVFFYPNYLPESQVIGFVVAGVGVLANALSSILGRNINRSGNLSPVAVTIPTMGAGGILLLASGIIIEGVPDFSLASWGIILWLAIVNSALAFTLWNKTLRKLSAMESSIINNTMLFQIAILAWLFLGETLSWRQITGIFIAIIGTILVQIRRTDTSPGADEIDPNSED